jgi:PAS domain S-box-containing protein
MKTLQIIGDDSCYRTLVDAITDCAICMIDPDGTVVTWNAGAERILGYPVEEIVGRHFSCLFAEDEQRAEKPYELLKTADRAGRFEDAVWQVRKNGGRLRALIVVDALRDHDGRVIGFAALIRDLSDRQQADDALRRSEERFRRVVEATPNAMVMIDQAGRIAMMNAQTERVLATPGRSFWGSRWRCSCRSGSAAAIPNCVRRSSAIIGRGRWVAGAISMD